MNACRVYIWAVSITTRAWVSTNKKSQQDSNIVDNICSSLLCPAYVSLFIDMYWKGHKRAHSIANQIYTQWMEIMRWYIVNVQSVIEIFIYYL